MSSDYQTNDLWIPHPKQIEALERSEFEILYGGSRGGGKTDAGLAWMAEETSNPEFRGLVLRRNSEDLKDWTDRANQLYSKLVNPAVKAGNPPEFKFKSGAIIRTGHLKDADAYTKYQGHEYHRILIEELTQIAELRQYLRLLSSCRSTVPSLKPQLFLTTNPGGKGHCVPHGEVITPKGFVDIKDVRVGDFVLTDDDGKTKFVKVDQKIVENYSGELVVSNNWSARFEATPNHKIVRVTETKDKSGRTFHKPKFIEVKDLPEITRLPKIGLWDGHRVFSFDPGPPAGRKKKLHQPRVISGNDYMELMGWFLSEGHTVSRDKAFGISQTKPQHRKTIKKLLNRIGFKYLISETGFLVHCQHWYDYFKIFGKCRDKWIPEIIKEAPIDQMKIFWQAMMDGDGNGNNYYTTSKKLADDMQEIGLKLGHRTYLSKRERKDRVGLSYTISFKDNKLGWIEKRNTHKKQYTGKVYCLGIDKIHRFYLRQNGSLYLSGNSWVKKRFIDPAEPGKTIWENGRSRVFIQATMDDNPTLMTNDPMYVANIEALREEDYETYMAWRFGDWDRFAGQVFSEFDRNKHIIPPVVPTEGTHYLWMDWGYSDHHQTSFSAYLSAVIKSKTLDGQNYHQVITYQEFCGNRKDPEEWARIIFNSCSEMGVKPKLAIADPAMVGTTKETSTLPGNLMVDEWKRLNGGKNWLNIIKGNNARTGRVGGVAVVHKWLSSPHDLPFWQITSTCKHLIRTLPMLVYDEHNVEDVDTSMEDHCLTGDTLILTNNSWIPIEKIPQAKITGYDKIVIDLVTTSGRKISCTENHKILTESGWKEAGSLKIGEKILLLSQIPYNDLSEETFINVANTTRGNQKDSQEVKDYIEKSGNFTMVQFQKPTTFTTSMKTKMKTLLKTLFSSKKEDIQACIPLTQQTDKGRLEEETQSSLPLQVIKNLQQHNVVEQLKWVGNRRRVDKVYDLGVEHWSHCFIANGFIVHNCYDACRYGLMHVRFIDVKPGSYSAKYEDKKIPLSTDERGLPAINPRDFFGSVS